ncbi:MAG: hypothetical protein RL701_3321 [Pseudomonadota bacterium]|jgi:hypothetical protein
MTPKTLKRTLAIKERLRQWRRAELYEAETAVADAERSVGVEAERHAGTCAVITRAGEISANDLVLAAEQLALAQRALKQAQSALTEREAEREVRKDVMGEATREVRAIEALHTRLVVEQRRAVDQNEQRELDEVASRKGAGKGRPR